MTIRTVSSPECLVALHDLCSAAAGTYTKTKMASSFTPMLRLPVITKQVRLAVIADNIIRVTASPS